MEDSVGEEERREQGEKMAQAKAHQEVVAAGDVGAAGGESAEEGGFLSAMASKIGATMSGTNGSGGDVNATVASGAEEGKGDGNGDPVDEGGFLSAMASKIGAAMSSANGGIDDGGGGNAAAASDREDKEKEDGGGGGGGIFHKLLSSPPVSSPASGAMEAEIVKGEEKGQEAAGEQVGILSSMASKIGKVMSAANGNGNHSTEDDNHGGSGDNAKTSNGNAVDGSKGDENGGGILSAMASKIGMAVSGANGNGNHITEDDAKEGTGDASHGRKRKGEEKEKGHDTDGGRIVEQIISNLPSDDQAPDADEASLLIAIIED